MPKEDGTPTTEELAQKQADEAKVKADAEAEAKKKQDALDAEIKAKEDKKMNLDKAIEEAETTLREKRKTAKEPQSGASGPEIPRIDDNAPEVKAWDQRIRDNTNPLIQESEREKAEVRQFALRKFLADKPALAADPAKVKELMDTYDRIKTATEKNQEGVLLDLNKAFAAVYHEQLIDAARTNRVERARELELFSEPAIDKGATGYGEDKAKMPNLSADDRKQLAAWGMTPEQWWEQKQKKAVA